MDQWDLSSYYTDEVWQLNNPGDNDVTFLPACGLTACPRKKRFVFRLSRQIKK